MLCKKLENLKLRIRKLNLLIFPNNHPLNLCSCQVRNKKKLIFFINGEPLARFPMLLLYNFVFSLLLLIIPSSSLKVIKVPSDFNMLIIIHQHIINEISDYFFIRAAIVSTFSLKCSISSDVTRPRCLLSSAMALFTGR